MLDEQDVKVNVRYANRLDLPLAFESYRAVTMSEDKDTAAKAFVRWLVTTNTKKLWLVADVNGEEAGMMLTHVDFHPFEQPPVFGFVDCVYVKKKFRNLGVMTDLFKFTFQWLTENKVPQLLGTPKNDQVYDGILGIKKYASVYIKKFQ